MAEIEGMMESMEDMGRAYGSSLDQLNTQDSIR